MTGRRPHLRQVASGVLVATSRFMTTTTTVVFAGNRALVVDPGVHDDELAAVAAELRDRGLTVSCGFATHAHWDHVLWHADLGSVPRWATPATAARAREERADLLEQAAETTVVDEARFGDLSPLPEPAVPWLGPEAVLVAHDAHERGHGAIHVPELGLLVAGDMTSDVEVPLLEHGIPGPEALAAYQEGLERLAALSQVSLVVPGHGTPCDVNTWRDRIDADRRYLDDLARGVRREDPRLREAWLRASDAEMGEALSKAAWRQWARDLPDPRAHAAAVGRHLQAFVDDRSPALVATYDALPGEIDVADLGSPAVALPRMRTDGGVSWHHVEGRLEPHRLGMRQPPAGSRAVDPADVDLALVPGLVFDRHGVRLGRGGGHYDRLLPQLRPGTPVVGVTAQGRVVPRLPTEPHDIPMTHLATEAGVHPVTPSA